MLESIEGKRGLPRQRPPFPAQVGLFGRPTLCNNVETLYWVRDIVEKGADWFTGHGRNGRKGLRTLFGVGAGARSRRQARAGRHHRAPADRRILRRHGRGSRLQGLSAGRCLGRHPAGGDGRHAARFRHARTTMAALPARARLSCCPTRTTCGRWRSTCCAFSRTRAAASARRAAPAPKRRSS